MSFSLSAVRSFFLYIDH